MNGKAGQFGAGLGNGAGRAMKMSGTMARTKQLNLVSLRFIGRGTITTMSGGKSLDTQQMICYSSNMNEKPNGYVDGVVFTISKDGGKTGIYWRANVLECLDCMEKYYKDTDWCVVAVKINSS